MNLLLSLPLVLSLVVCIVSLPNWIKKARKMGLIWEDMNVYKHPRNLAGSGGLIVILSFIFGVLAYVAIKTFVFNVEMSTVEIFALLTTVIISSVIGIIDDFIGWHRGGLSVKVRIFLTIIAAVPLMVINAGVSKINIPFIGLSDIGIFYPLILIPIAIVGATTTYNFLAGMKGLEAGQGMIVVGFLSFIAYVTGNSWLAVIGLIMVASLLGFYFFNIKPGKVLPGDALTYGVGALIACMAILGNFEKIALFVFIPYIIETILKLRGRLKKSSFGIPNQDNSLEVPFKKFYGLTHISLFVLNKIKGKAYEREVTYLIFCLQILICLLALWIFRASLFLS
jgi:UDP-N-acetylglucosamine--dolichyl-phosphate N-acetylglucosaminephosphotransferase